MIERIQVACGWAAGNWRCLWDFWPVLNRPKYKAVVSVTRYVTVPGVVAILRGEEPPRASGEFV